MRKVSKKATSIKNKFQLSPWHYLLIAGIVIVSFLFLRGNYGYIQYKQLEKQKKELIQQISDLKKEQTELEQEIGDLLNNYLYIEKIVREKYKMGKDGEKIYFMISPSDKERLNK
ncbi:septum formation initiator family protein [candidate division KSB1 bacterium]|nr:septum formation initiator family protein [candidate division KSB1 bacterium]